MVDRQIMSKPSAQVPVEQAVSKQVASDGLSSLAAVLAKSGITLYKAYETKDLRDTKTEALGKAWQIAQTIKQARESGQITPLEAKSNLNKALTGLTSQYGFDVQSAMAETMSRAFKWNKDYLKGTKVDELYQNYRAMGFPDNTAHAMAVKDVYAEYRARYFTNMGEADPAVKAMRTIDKEVTELRLKLGLKDQEKAYKVYVALNNDEVMSKLDPSYSATKDFNKTVQELVQKTGLSEDQVIKAIRLTEKNRLMSDASPEFKARQDFLKNVSKLSAETGMPFYKVYQFLQQKSKIDFLASVDPEFKANLNAQEEIISLAAKTGLPFKDAKKLYYSANQDDIRSKVDQKYLAQKEVEKEIALYAEKNNMDIKDARVSYYRLQQLKTQAEKLKNLVSTFENQDVIVSRQLGKVSSGTVFTAISDVYNRLVYPILKRKGPITEQEKQTVLQNVHKYMTNIKTESTTKLMEWVRQGKISQEVADKQMKFIESSLDNYSKTLEDLVTTRDINKAETEEYKFQVLSNMIKENPDLAFIMTAAPGALNGLLGASLKAMKAPNEATRLAVLEQIKMSAMALTAVLKGEDPEGSVKTLNKGITEALHDEKDWKKNAEIILQRLSDPSYDGRGKLWASALYNQGDFNILYNFDKQRMSSIIDSEVDTFLRHNKEFSLDAKDMSYKVENGIPVIYLTLKKDGMNNPMIYKMKGTSQVPLDSNDPLSKMFLMLYRKANAEGRPFGEVFNLYKNKLLQINK